MKKPIKIGIILAVTGIIAAALIWKLYINKPHSDINNATPAYSMSTEDLWKSYTTNNKTADSVYTGKVIELKGNLSRVDKNDSLVSVIFVMDADPMFGDKTISCQMYTKHNNEAVSLATGTNIKIKGFCTGYNETDIIFNKCSVIQ